MHLTLQMHLASTTLRHLALPVPFTAALDRVGAAAGVSVGQAGGPLVQVAAAGTRRAVQVALLAIVARAESLHDAGGAEWAGFTGEGEGAYCAEDGRDRAGYEFNNRGRRRGLDTVERDGEVGVGGSGRLGI